WLKSSLQRELLVTKPTSLGDAFSLVRVTEARLEDQWVTPPASRSAVASGLLQLLLMQTAEWEDISIYYITGLPASKGSMAILCIKMTPYQALYGRVPPSIILYLPGSSKVAAVDEGLVERDVLLRQLRENLLAARNRMEMQANRSRREVEFNVGDKVLFKLQPCWNEWARWRRLKLPSTSKIDPVFHVSLLKLFTRAGIKGISSLPEEEHEGHPLDQPLTVCATSAILRNGEPIRQILVQ
ncbi:hypothetical protein Tco_1397346, partial [Tanacetum coccineum]